MCCGQFQSNASISKNEPTFDPGAITAVIELDDRLGLLAWINHSGMRQHFQAEAVEIIHEKQGGSSIAGKITNADVLPVAG